MSYKNITYTLTKPAENYVDSNWVYSRETTFIKKHVLARGAHFVLAPALFITSALDTIVGLGVGIGALCTLGKHKPTYKIASYHLSSANKLFVRPYVNLLRVINPEAKFSGDLDNLFIGFAKQAMISGSGDGFLSDLVANPLLDIARSCYNSDNFLKRHVASRLTYALLAVSYLVSGVRRDLLTYCQG